MFITQNWKRLLRHTARYAWSLSVLRIDQRRDIGSNSDVQELVYKCATRRNEIASE